MVFPIRGDRSGFRRCDTRKISEFMNQMGLVVITVLESHFAPGDLFAADNLIQDGLKTLNAEIRFGGESDRILELPNEALVSDRLIRCIVFYCEAGVRSTGCLLSSAGGEPKSARLYQKNFPPFLRSKNSKNGGLKVCLGVRQQDYFFLLVFPLAVLVVGSTVLPVCFLAPCPILEVDLAITRSPVIRRLRNRYELRYSYRRVNYQSLQNLKYQSTHFLNICEEYFQIVFSRRSLEASQQRRTVAVGGCESHAPLLCSRFH